MQEFLTKHNYIITNNPDDYVLQNVFLLEYRVFFPYAATLTEIDLLSIGICEVNKIITVIDETYKVSKYKKVLTGIKYEN